MVMEEHFIDGWWMKRWWRGEKAIWRRNDTSVIMWCSLNNNKKHGWHNKQSPKKKTKMILKLSRQKIQLFLHNKSQLTVWFLQLHVHYFLSKTTYFLVLTTPNLYTGMNDVPGWITPRWMTWLFCTSLLTDHSTSQCQFQSYPWPSAWWSRTRLWRNMHAGYQRVTLKNGMSNESC